jgi:hypothetical protein
MNKWIKIKDKNEDEKLINLNLVDVISVIKGREFSCNGITSFFSPVIGFEFRTKSQALESWAFGTQEECDKKYKELKEILGVKDE